MIINIKINDSIINILKLSSSSFNLIYSFINEAFAPKQQPLHGKFNK